MKKLLIATFGLMLMAVVGLRQSVVVAQGANQNGVAAGQTRAVSPELAEAARLNASVIKLFKEEKYDEALPLATRVLAIREKSLAADHQLIASSLTNLAEIYVKQKKFKEAEALLQRLLSITVKRSGAESLPVATVLHRLGMVQFREHDTVAAESSLLRALSLREKLLPPDNVELALSLFSLAEYYAGRADYKRAAPLYQRALAIWEKKLDKKDPQLTSVTNRYICFLDGRERVDDIRSFLQGRRDYRVGDELLPEGIAYGTVTFKLQPPYPLGNNSFISYNRTVIKTLVDETGKVVKAVVLCGDRTLAGPSLRLALKERFQPTFAEGKPVRVSSLIIYQYGTQLAPMPRP